MSMAPGDVKTPLPITMLITMPKASSAPRFFAKVPRSDGGSVGAVPYDGSCSAPAEISGSWASSRTPAADIVVGVTGCQGL